MPPLNILGFWNRVTKFLPKFSYNYKNKMSKMNMKIKNNIKEKKGDIIMEIAIVFLLYMAWWSTQ